MLEMLESFPAVMTTTIIVRIVLYGTQPSQQAPVQYPNYASVSSQQQQQPSQATPSAAAVVKKTSGPGAVGDGRPSATTQAKQQKLQQPQQQVRGRSVLLADATCMSVS